MASLMENLIDILEEENTEYVALTEKAERKKDVIIKGDIEKLQQITDEEQIILDRVTSLEKKREEVTRDVASVLNRDVNTLKLIDLIQMLAVRPVEQQKLQAIHEKLGGTVRNMMRLNEQNRELLQNALELVEFDVNLIQSFKAAPETANYNKGAYNAGSIMGSNANSFDAKQ